MGKKFFIISCGILLVLLVAYMYSTLLTQVQVAKEADPEIGFPTTEARNFVERTTSEDDRAAPSSSITTDVEMSLLPAPGGLVVQSLYSRKQLIELLTGAQRLPETDGVVQYVLVQAREYDIRMIPDETFAWIIDVTLKVEPLHFSRALAEGEVAGKLTIEREDLCGLPFNIHTEKGHPASTLGNLGLQICGADKLSGSPWGSDLLP